MKTLNNSIIAAVLTIGSFSITHSQETEIKGGNTETSIQPVSSEKGAGSQVESSQNASDETNIQAENRGIDKKDVRRMSSANQNSLYEDKNKEGVNPLYGVQRKGINEGGLKKNAIDVSQEDNGTDASARTEGKLKGKIIKGGDNGMISVSGENQETPTARKGWEGSVKGGKTETQRKGIIDADSETAISEKKGLNAVNVKLSKTDSNYKDGEDGVSHTRPGNHKPGKSDATTTEDHAINEKGYGANRDGRAMLGLKGTALTNGHSVDGSDETNPNPQEHAVRTKGSGATTGPDVKPVKVDEIKLGQVVSHKVCK